MGSAQVLSVAWAPDGASLASGSVDKTVRIFNLEDGTCQKVLEGHRYRLNAALGKSVIGETGAGYSQCPVRGQRALLTVSYVTELAVPMYMRWPGVPTAS